MSDLRWVHLHTDRWQTADGRFTVRRVAKFTLKNDAMKQYVYTVIDNKEKKALRTHDLQTAKRKACEWYERN